VKNHASFDPLLATKFASFGRWIDDKALRLIARQIIENSVL
jgi:hypothetical protein